ncbi:hypothetical protein UJ101_02380 [Flavobacteriaceae bacterium UJ101]|nr:hypothetical protein UJ101_02380 [Flavobacteriaceae bacterium UJ101]
MNKKNLHKYLSILGALLLWMQIIMVSFHQIEHQHDDTTQQKCHLCVFHSHHHFIENDPILEFKIIEPAIFHEEIAIIQENLYTSKQKESYFLRGPPYFHI